MKLKRSLLRGLKTIGGTDGCRLCISYAGSCTDGWKDFYKEYKYPWQMWFKNPILHNRSGYDDILCCYRFWFIFMWHIVSFRMEK